MKEYVLNCPNALINPKKGLVIGTQFFYESLEDAKEHKALCDLWDKEQGKEPQSYIEERAV